MWVQNERLAPIYERFYAFMDDLEKGHLFWDGTSSDGWYDLGEDDMRTLAWDDAPLPSTPLLHSVGELVEDQRGLLAERLPLEQSVDPLVADAARFARQNAGG